MADCQMSKECLGIAIFVILIVLLSENSIKGWVDHVEIGYLFGGCINALFSIVPIGDTSNADLFE